MKGPEILPSLLYLTHKISYLKTTSTGRVFSNIYLDIDCHTYAPVRCTLGLQRRDAAPNNKRDKIQHIIFTASLYLRDFGQFGR